MRNSPSAAPSPELAAPPDARDAEAAAPRRVVYVWDLPVRITHWVNVATIVVLSFTGYYIASPFIGTQGDATSNFLMGAMRFTHFVAAFVFTASVLFRIYWAFRGGRFARWDQFVPLRRRRRQALWRMMGYYTFLRKRPPEEIGHNPLAGITYVGLYVLFGLQILTGFALYSQGFAGGFWPSAFGWMIVLFGAPPLRLVHAIIMWLIFAFTIHHVYSAVLIDVEERSGLVSSIVTGSKALTPEHIAAAREEETPAPRNRGMRDAS